MAYQVLARKWRPKSFAQLVGQEHVIKALANAFANDRLHHAYLLTGTRGVGKTTIARIMAKALNCETGVTATPCGVCSACTQIDAGRFVDLLEIDAASNTGIDNIREVLDNAQYSPTAGRYKVYIIDEVHMLSKSAFNAMLKTLEEPPAHVKFILATTDPQKVPITVLSRCLQFSLRQMTPQQVSGHLAQVLQAEEINFEQGALNILGHAANGSMRDALSLLDQAIAYGGGDVGELAVRAMLGAVDQSYLFDILQALIAGDGNAVLATADAIAGRGLSYESALHELAHLLHQVAVAQAVPKALADDLPQRAQIAALAEAMSPEDTQLYYQIALHGRRDLPLAPDEYAGFSMTLLRMLAFAPAEASQINLPSQAASPTLTATPAIQAVPTPAPAPNPPVQQQAAPRPPISDEPAHYDAPPWHEEERAAPPAPAAPATPSAPVTKGPFNGDWRALILQLKLGAAGMLAQNAELLGYTANSIELLVGEEHTAVASRAYQEKLREALSNHFGHDILLTITLGSASGDTPAAIALREKLARLATATQSIQNDPFVQSVVRDFGATVIPDSIKPLN
ncbi:DNA polymerase III subunit gamma/tau [Janthinobacterium sp. B9-8]|uniref:DNA polymerase III subunit gamma/tau n=1 Tax=Janthinobacterium sp. B9-8 TaxID=1236179 RepID=UPI00061D38A9|nr:DNA polymerase III subunit gamma/tau [Janthinobacterium sp. B9-8]AMC33756.1 DNA polymerase III subunit gamma/tau [Janthinobacterium sp. B9-8]